MPVSATHRIRRRLLAGAFAILGTIALFGLAPRAQAQHAPVAS